MYELRSFSFYYPEEKSDLLDMLYLNTAFKNDDGNYNETYMNWGRHPIRNANFLQIYETFYNKNQLKNWSPIFISSRHQPLFDESFVEHYTIVNFHNSPTFQINASIKQHKNIFFFIFFPYFFFIIYFIKVILLKGKIYKGKLGV